jgi:hypothetical protein
LNHSIFFFAGILQRKNTKEMWLVYGSLLLLALLAHMLLCLVISHNAPPPTIRDAAADEKQEEEVREVQDDVSEKTALIPVSKPTSPTLNATTDRLSDDGWEALEVLDSQV